MNVSADAAAAVEQVREVLAAVEGCLGRLTDERVPLLVRQIVRDQVVEVMSSLAGLIPEIERVATGVGEHHELVSRDEGAAAAQLAEAESGAGVADGMASIPKYGMPA